MSEPPTDPGAAPGGWTSAVWATEALTTEVRAFVAGALGLPDGPDGVRLEPFHARPWSSVWTATTPDGRRWYVKQNAPPQSHETRVVLRLAALAPDDVVPVAGADAERDLLLTPDLGDTVRERYGDGDVDAWCRVVAAGADLQRRVADDAATWRLWTLRPEDAAADLAARVDRLAALPHDDPRRLDADRAAALRDLLPRVRGWGEEVAALGLPLTLNHNDLHAANALVDDDTASGLRFFDFGDCVRTEPLAVLAVPLAVLADQWGEPGRPPPAPRARRRPRGVERPRPRPGAAGGRARRRPARTARAGGVVAAADHGDDRGRARRGRVGRGRVGRAAARARADRCAR